MPLFRTYTAASCLCLTCVCPLMGLERLLSGKHSVADVAADAAGGGLALVDQLADGVSPWSTSADPILTTKTHTKI